MLLYSFSSIDAEKWQELVGTFTGKTVMPAEQLDVKTAREKAISVEGVEKTDQENEDTANVMVDEYEDEFDALYEAIRLYIITNQLEKKISVSKEDDVVIIRFLEVIFI